jgi:hypothetical protein
MKEHCILFKIYTKGLYHGKQFEFCFQDSAGGGDVLEHGKLVSGCGGNISTDSFDEGAGGAEV